MEEAPDGSLSRAGLAGYLSAALLTRFVRSGSQADLDGAAAAGRTAVGAAKALAPGHRNGPGRYGPRPARAVRADQGPAVP